MRIIKIVALITSILFLFSSAFATEDMIKAMENLDRIEKTTCLDKAIDNFIGYSRVKPDELANLSTLTLENEKKITGAISLTYSMNFLVEDRVVLKKTKVRSLNGMCF